MNNYELILEIQDVISKIYKEESLTCLRGLDSSYKLNNRQILLWHSTVTRKCSVKYNGQFHHHQNFDDILFCSDELLYYTAYLYLYRPHINNPIKDGHDFSGGMIYPNYQNMSAKRYSMFSDIVSQCAYNYWDRIGDLIASFFPDKIKPHKVFFGTAIEAIPGEFHSSENFTWLNSFKENGYKDLNNRRKHIVHYTTSDTSFKYQHLDVVGDEEGMMLLQAEREALPEFYKGHILETLEGFERTLLLLEEVNAKLFTDIPD